MKLLVIAAFAAVLALAGAATPAPSVVGSSIFTATVTSQKTSDGRVITNKQLRDRHGDVVGWGNTVCFVLGNGSAQCIGTFVLPNGKINVAGTRHNQNFFTLSIVGGQGVYDAAGGTVIANTVTNKPLRERLVFFFS